MAGFIIYNRLRTTHIFEKYLFHDSGIRIRLNLSSEWVGCDLFAYVCDLMKLHKKKYNETKSHDVYGQMTISILFTLRIFARNQLRESGRRKLFSNFVLKTDLGIFTLASSLIRPYTLPAIDFYRLHPVKTKLCV